MRTLTIKRESEFIFYVTSNFAFWSSGDGKINERMAFDGKGILSNLTAQSLDRANGKGYILLSPFSVKNPVAIQVAKFLSIGQSETVSV